MEESLFKWLGYISYFATIAIITLVTIRSIADVARGMGILPSRFYTYLYANEDERITRLLDKLGVLPRIKYFRSVTQNLDSPLDERISTDAIRIRFRELMADHIVDGPYVIGDTSRVEITRFLNLRRALCVTDDDKELISLMANFVQNILLEVHAEAKCIVSRKGGIDILGYRVARLLHMRFLLYNDTPAIWQHQKGKGTEKIPKYLEYDPNGCDCAIIIDDSCVSASSILQMSKVLQEMSIRVEHAFVFFERTEGGDSERLRDIGVSLHSLDQYNDDVLEDMRKTSGGIKAQAA